MLKSLHTHYLNN